MINEVVGLDISKKDVTAAMLKNGQAIKQKFINNYGGFKKLQQWITRHSTSKLKVCMEATGSYGFSIADFLYKEGHEIYVVNPVCIKSFAQSILSRNKTDEVDAVIIAEYITKMPVRPYKPLAKSHYKLRYLYRCLDDLKSQQTQVINHIKDKDHLPKTVIKVWQQLVKTIELQIQNIVTSIEKLIEGDYDINRDYINLQTIPGIGKTTAAAILAETPDISDFTNARQFAAFAGVTPRQRQSGSSLKGKTRLSKIGSAKLRKVIYFPAIVGKNHNPIIKEFCLNLKKKSKHNMVIVGAAMRKLMHIIFGVLKHKKPFMLNPY